MSITRATAQARTASRPPGAEPEGKANEAALSVTAPAASGLGVGAPRPWDKTPGTPWNPPSPPAPPSPSSADICAREYLEEAGQDTARFFVLLFVLGAAVCFAVEVVRVARGA